MVKYKTANTLALEESYRKNWELLGRLEWERGIKAFFGLCGGRTREYSLRELAEIAISAGRISREELDGNPEHLERRVVSCFEINFWLGFIPPYSMVGCRDTDQGRRYIIKIRT